MADGDVPAVPLRAGPGSGYTIEFVGDGLVYQYDETGRLVQIAVDVIDPRRPWFMVPDEAAHEQGDEPPAELGPEWKPLGFYTPDEQLAEVEKSGAAALRAEEVTRRSRPSK